MRSVSSNPSFIRSIIDKADSRGSFFRSFTVSAYSISISFSNSLTNSLVLSRISQILTTSFLIELKSSKISYGSKSFSNFYLNRVT